jgi:transcriptional regulator with XRE-family HTH domain
LSEPSPTPRARTWNVRSGTDLGRAVADIRAERGMTQSELAQIAGLERTYLSRIESGSSVQHLDRALRALRRLGAIITVTMPGDDR